VDGLRLWVALNASENCGSVQMSSAVLAELDERITQLRRILRFLLGSLHDYTPSESSFHDSGDMAILDQVLFLIIYNIP
jgi:isoleucyl-tRNA synthetase